MSQLAEQLKKYSSQLRDEAAQLAILLDSHGGRLCAQEDALAAHVHRGTVEIGLRLHRLLLSLQLATETLEPSNRTAALAALAEPDGPLASRWQG